MELNPFARAVSTVALAATAFFTLAAFMQLPADAVLAIHWNINGVADGFAGKEALLIIPVTTALVGALLWLAVRYDPKRANIARSADALGLVVVALSLLVAVTQSAIINSGFGEAARLDGAAPDRWWRTVRNPWLRHAKHPPELHHRRTSPLDH